MDVHTSFLLGLAHLSSNTDTSKESPKRGAVVPKIVAMLIVGEREEAGSMCFVLTAGTVKGITALELASHLLLFASRRADLVRDLIEGSASAPAQPQLSFQSICLFINLSI